MGKTGYLSGAIAAVITKEAMDRMAADIVRDSKAKIPLFMAHPRTPAKGLVHTWTPPSSEDWPFGTVLLSKLGLHVLYLGRGYMLDLSNEEVFEGNMAAHWTVVEAVTF